MLINSCLQVVSSNSEQTIAVLQQTWGFFSYHEQQDIFHPIQHLCSTNAT